MQEGPLVRYVSLQMMHVEKCFNPLEYIFPVLFSRREESSEINIKPESLNTFCYSVWKLSSVYLSMALQPFVGPLPLFQCLNPIHRTPWTGDQPVARPLPPHRTAQTQNRRIETFMPQVVFKPTIPMLERAKTVHASDREAIVTGRKLYSPRVFSEAS
jgi:hypothetical protein